MTNLTPWALDLAPSDVARLRDLAPATMPWFAVYFWIEDDGTPVLNYEPVIGWVIQGAKTPDDDDAVVPVVRFEDGPDLTVADSTGGMEPPLALITGHERSDEAMAAHHLEMALKVHAANLANTDRENRERDTVHRFVEAQPDPAAFAALMRRGARSLSHAFLAITLSDGDPALAAQLALRKGYELVTMLSKRSREGR